MYWLNVYSLKIMLKKQPERDVAMKRQPGVVEAKSHEWKQEIHLWVYVVVVTLMFLESWWWSQYCFFFCLLLVILATVFSHQRHACWPLTIHTTWWWWKRPVCWSGASCPWCPFGSLHCCHRHPFCRNDEQLYKQHEYQLDIPLLLLSLLLKLLLWFLKKSTKCFFLHLWKQYCKARLIVT